MSQPSDASEFCPPSLPPLLVPLEILGGCLSLGVSVRLENIQVIQAHKSPDLLPLLHSTWHPGFSHQRCLL